MIRSGNEHVVNSLCDSIVNMQTKKRNRIQDGSRQLEIADMCVVFVHWWLSCRPGHLTFWPTSGVIETIVIIKCLADCCGRWCVCKSCYLEQYVQVRVLALVHAMAIKQSSLFLYLLIQSSNLLSFSISPQIHCVLPPFRAMAVNQLLSFSISPQIHLSMDMQLCLFSHCGQKRWLPYSYVCDKLYMS